MNIAIPEVKKSVASCFEVARHFRVFNIKNKKIRSSKCIKCHGCEDFERVRLLRLYEIRTLICNGINRFYRDQLRSLGITVIPNVNGTINKAIDNFLNDELPVADYNTVSKQDYAIVSHDELIAWTKTLFENLGYSVRKCRESEATLIDLVARIQCPMCKKDIKVAICCGAQIYKVDQEIMEFHYITQSGYNARVYVYLTDPFAEKSCDEYGITFLSPEYNQKQLEYKTNKIPIIQTPILGHEQLIKSEL